jgi:hypothetical protein
MDDHDLIVLNPIVDDVRIPAEPWPIPDFAALHPGYVLASRLVTRYAVTRYGRRNPMTAPAERMKMMRQRRRARGLRELRLVVADARSRAVRRRVAKQVAGLDPGRERDALRWIESISEFDADATR